VINIEYDGVPGKFIPDPEYTELLYHSKQLQQTTDKLFSIIVKQSKLLELHNLSPELMEGEL